MSLPSNPHAPMDSNTDIHGGNNQILPNADHAIQYNVFHIQPQPGNFSDSYQAKGEYRLYVGHDNVNVPGLIRNARNHIVLHAAYYPKYGLDDKGKVLMDALENNPRLRLHAIFTEIDGNPWIDEFTKVLRDFIPSNNQKEVMRLSIKYFLGMKESLPNKNQIRISTTRRLPMFPVILVDDTLIVGHYAHSSTPAPQGLWMTIKHPGIPLMYDRLCCDSLNRSQYSEEELAILRYLEELRLN